MPNDPNYTPLNTGLDPEAATTILPATSTIGAGSAYSMPQKRGFGGTVDNYTWQVVLTGAPTGWEVDLQGSNDGKNWSLVDKATNADANATSTGETRYVQRIATAFLRANLVTLSGGTSPTASVIINMGA